MNITLKDLIEHLLSRLRGVQESLGMDPTPPADPEAPFAELMDSMALVEFVGLLAEDCGVAPAVIEECAGKHFTTVTELARAMHAVGLGPRSAQADAELPRPVRSSVQPAAPTGQCWLVGTAVRLPRTIQHSTEIDHTLHRPAGWLESHAGIRQRRIWADEEPLDAAADAGRECLHRAGLSVRDVGALCVTSEAPPVLAGLAAALHHGLELGPQAVALEVGGACTGFLAALWAAEAVLPRSELILVIAVEAHSRHLSLGPGSSGEAAALFGDAAAACLIGDRPLGQDSIPVAEVVLGADGGAGRLLQVQRSAGNVELQMEGVALAARAVRVMAQATREMTQRHGLAVADLAAVVAHGGNGRMAGLLARQLGLPAECVWSETSHTGNLGSASLPVAWAAQSPPTKGPLVWTAVGAGLTWGVALTGRPPPLD